MSSERKEEASLGVYIKGAYGKLKELNLRESKQAIPRSAVAH